MRRVAPLLLLACGVAALSFGLERVTASGVSAPVTTRLASVLSDRPRDHRPLVRAGDGLPGVPTAFADPSGHALDRAYAALARAEDGGQARFAFYGGSHTAGDLYTGRLRELLQQRFGDLGHGWVPLVPVVHRHWAWAMVIDAAEGFEVQQVALKRPDTVRYGLAGVRFLGYEPSAFAAVESDDWGSGRFADRVTLVYDRVPDGGAFEVWLDGELVAARSARAEPAATGLWTQTVSDGPHRVEVRVAEAPVTVYGALFERGGAGVMLDNLGLVGSKARHHLRWDEAQWAPLLAAREPDLVAFAYGNNETNDTYLELSDHEAHLREMLARIRRAVPDAACLLIGPTDRIEDGPGGQPVGRRIVADITEMYRRVAAEEGCALFDTLAFQGGLGATVPWRAHEPSFVGHDLIHLSRHGYRRWGEALYDAMMAGYDRWQSRREGR